MALHYTVKHAFNRANAAGEDVWYTTENAEAIKALPRADRDELIKLGHIIEHDDRSDAAAPAAPATTAKGGK